MEFIKKNKGNIVVLVIWLIITVITMFHHEIWRDEAQAWCIVRDCNLLSVLQYASLEGHPVLWYVLLFPLAKAGLPVLSMQIFSLLLVFLAILYFLFKSPFNIIEKMLVTFSCGFLYFLSLIPRNYALIPIFLFITADLYKNRHKNPFKYIAALIFLSNTHALIMGLCTILFILFAIERIKNHKENVFSPIFLFIINFVILVLSMFSAFHNHAIVNYMTHSKDFFTSAKEFPVLFFEFHFIPDIFYAIIFYVLVLSLFLCIFKYSKKLFIVFIFSEVFIFTIYQKIWFNGIQGQKAFLCLLIIIFIGWLFNETYKSKIFNYLFVIIFLISSLNSVIVIEKELKNNFSGSKQTAEFIKINLEKDKTICTVGSPFTFTGISAYLPDKKLYSLINKYYITFYDFNDKVRKTKVEEPMCSYYIVQKDFVLNDEFEIIFSSDDYVLSSKEFSEVFNIYKKKAMT